MEYRLGARIEWQNAKRAHRKGLLSFAATRWTSCDIVVSFCLLGGHIEGSSLPFAGASGLYVSAVIRLRPH